MTALTADPAGPTGTDDHAAARAFEAAVAAWYAPTTDGWNDATVQRHLADAAVHLAAVVLASAPQGAGGPLQPRLGMAGVALIGIVSALAAEDDDPLLIHGPHTGYRTMPPLRCALAAAYCFAQGAERVLVGWGSIDQSSGTLLRLGIRDVAAAFHLLHALANGQHLDLRRCIADHVAGSGGPDLR